MQRPDATLVQELRARAHRTAGSLRLPLSRQVWRGLSGNWSGAGIGSSIDFQDHRPYLPGDDPRYMDWPAFARTGHYILKLYREEVSPLVDLVLDDSASMDVVPAKAERALELFFFAWESAARSGAMVRSWLVDSAGARPLAAEAVRSQAFGPPGTPGAEPALDRVPLRAGSLRVLISDLLFPGDPEARLRTLCGARGRLVVFAPYAPEEAEPDWDGNIEFEDCESGAERLQHIAPDVLARYRLAYARHLDLWDGACRRRGAALARVPSAGSLADALRTHALQRGAVEPCT
jgi:uncharacterized protein (DUF58 family)